MLTLLRSLRAMRGLRGVGRWCWNDPNSASGRWRRSVGCRGIELWCLPRLCTDNGVMIATLGAHRRRRGAVAADCCHRPSDVGADQRLLTDISSHPSPSGQWNPPSWARFQRQSGQSVLLPLVLGVAQCEGSISVDGGS